MIMSDLVQDVKTGNIIRLHDRKVRKMFDAATEQGIKEITCSFQLSTDDNHYMHYEENGIRTIPEGMNDTQTFKTFCETYQPEKIAETYAMRLFLDTQILRTDVDGQNWLCFDIETRTIELEGSGEAWLDISKKWDIDAGWKREKV
jgi:hypothetical protein